MSPQVSQLHTQPPTLDDLARELQLVRAQRDALLEAVKAAYVQLGLDRLKHQVTSRAELILFDAVVHGKGGWA